MSGQGRWGIIMFPENVFGGSSYGPIPQNLENNAEFVKKIVNKKVLGIV